MVGSNVRVEGSLDRQALEQLLPKLVRDQQVVRLKGRVWLQDKTFPLQVQMVGPRLNSWFEVAPSHAWRPEAGCESIPNASPKWPLNTRNLKVNANSRAYFLGLLHKTLSDCVIRQSSIISRF